jgi:hypothetical protein
MVINFECKYSQASAISDIHLFDLWFSGGKMLTSQPENNPKIVFL